MVGVVLAKDLFMVQNCPLMKYEFGKSTVPQHVAHRILSGQANLSLLKFILFLGNQHRRAHWRLCVLAEMRKEHWAETICRVLGL
jgi:hypothetical protein